MSLVYLAVQILQNTRAVRASSFHAVTDSFNLLNAAIGRTFHELGYPALAREYYRAFLSGQVDDDNDFGNTPLSNFDVNFYDLTGSTNATISCVDGNGSPVGSSSTNEAASPETTLTANAQTIGTYTCTITIVDP